MTNPADQSLADELVSLPPEQRAERLRLLPVDALAGAALALAGGPLVELAGQLGDRLDQVLLGMPGDALTQLLGRLRDPEVKAVVTRPAPRTIAVLGGRISAEQALRVLGLLDPIAALEVVRGAEPDLVLRLMGAMAQPALDRLLLGVSVEALADAATVLRADVVAAITERAPLDRLVAVAERMPPAVSAKAVRHLSDARAAALAERMQPKAVAALASELDDASFQRILSKLPMTKRVEVLRHAGKSTGSLALKAVRGFFK